LFALAEAVGPTGHVTGIDLAPRMVAATQADARARGLTHVEVHVMDATSPRVTASSYDVAVASFVLFFLPAPVAALRAWRELLVPGGRLGLSTFAESEGGWLEEVFRPYLPSPVFGAHSSTAARPFNTDAGVAYLVESAGFGRVLTSSFELEVVFTDCDQWHAWSWSHGQRAIWERVPAGDRDRVRMAAAERLQEFRTRDGTIKLTQPIRFTLAERID
jgi:SAM-dependent methyltransferase